MYPAKISLDSLIFYHRFVITILSIVVYLVSMQFGVRKKKRKIEENRITVVKVRANDGAKRSQLTDTKIKGTKKNGYVWKTVDVVYPFLTNICVW